MKKIILIFLVALLGIPTIAFAQHSVDTIYSIIDENTIDTSMMYKDANGKYHYKIDTLSDKQEAELKKAAENKTAVFFSNIKSLWNYKLQGDNTKDMSEREFLNKLIKELQKETYELFIGDAAPYYEDLISDYRVYSDADNKDYYSKHKKEGWKRYYISDKSQIFTKKDGHEYIGVKELQWQRARQIWITSLYKQTGKPDPVKKYIDRITRKTSYDTVIINVNGFTPAGNLQPVSGQPGVYEGTIHCYQDFTGIRGDGIEYSDRTYRTVKYRVRLVVVGTLAYWEIKLGDILATKTTTQPKN